MRDIISKQGQVVADLLLLPQTWSGALTDYRMALLLAVVGLVCITIAKNYRDNPRSATYKLSMIVGVFTATVLGAHVALQYLMGSWSNTMVMITAVIVFGLLFRPLMNRNIAFVIAALVLIGVYMSIAVLVPDLYALLTVDGLLLLSFMVATLIYVLLHFAEAGMEFVARVLNAWPILIVLGLLCIVEGIAIAAGYPLISGI